VVLTEHAGDHPIDARIRELQPERREVQQTDGYWRNPSRRRYSATIAADTSRG